MVTSFRLLNLYPEIESQENDKPMNGPVSQSSLAWYNNIVGPKQETGDIQPGLGPMSEVPNGKIASCTVYWLC